MEIGHVAGRLGAEAEAVAMARGGPRGFRDQGCDGHRLHRSSPFPAGGAGFASGFRFHGRGFGIHGFLLPASLWLLCRGGATSSYTLFHSTESRPAPGARKPLDFVPWYGPYLVLREKNNPPGKEDSMKKNWKYWTLGCVLAASGAMAAAAMRTQASGNCPGAIICPLSGEKICSLECPL